MKNACEKGSRLAADWMVRLDYLKELAKVAPQYQPIVEDLEKKIDHLKMLCQAGMRVPIG
jgi:hypothetical protein